jgi:hypothetical protein
LLIFKTLSIKIKGVKVLSICFVSGNLEVGCWGWGVGEDKIGFKDCCTAIKKKKVKKA